MKYLLCIYIFTLLLGCTSCSFTPVQEKYKTLPKERWERDSNYKFEFNITQTGNYHISICIRHTSDYKQKNIGCNLSISRQGTTLLNENTDVTLVDNNGEWLGEGLPGLKSLVQPVNPILTADSVGVYTIEVKHRMKDKQLNGIKNIGIKINKFGN